MGSSLDTAAESMRAAVAAIDPSLVPEADCARWAEELARTEKACAALRLLLSVRAVCAGKHRERGFADGAAWLAVQSGSTVSSARRALGVAAGLDTCPDTRAALLGGEISLPQAAEIVEAQAEAAVAEESLLPVARTATLTRLRDQAREHRQAHIDAEALRARQFRRRHFRHWTDRDGMVCITGALPPEHGLPLISRIRETAERLYRSAKANRSPDDPNPGFDAYAADALAELAVGSQPNGKGSLRTDLVLVCDINAYRRGHAHPGEVCHIIGGGPIPVSLGRRLGEDAFLKAVLHDGTAITTVKHFGRHLSAPLRTALDLGPVPEFTGRQCVDCGSRVGLEYDHVDPVANHGPTSYDNLKPRCWWDHQLKTERDRQAGRLGRHPPRAPDTS